MLVGNKSQTDLLRRNGQANYSNSKKRSKPFLPALSTRFGFVALFGCTAISSGLPPGIVASFWLCRFIRIYCSLLWTHRRLVLALLLYSNVLLSPLDLPALSPCFGFVALFECTPLSSGPPSCIVASFWLCCLLRTTNGEKERSARTSDPSSLVLEPIINLILKSAFLDISATKKSLPRGAVPLAAGRP